MRHFISIFLVILGFVGCEVVSILSISEVLGDTAPILERFDHYPFLTLLIFFSVFLFIWGKNDDSNVALNDLCLLGGAIASAFVGALSKGDLSLEVCVTSSLSFTSYYVMYSLGRFSQRFNKKTTSIPAKE